MDFAFLGQTMLTLLEAVPMTLALFSLSILSGGILALCIVWMRVAGGPVLRTIAKTYIRLSRIAAAGADVPDLLWPWPVRCDPKQFCLALFARTLHLCRPIVGALHRWLFR